MPVREEAIVYGVNAALAVARHRSEALLRVFHTRERRKVVGPLLSAAAISRRPYREVTSDELTRIAKTLHHEGVVVVCQPMPLVPFEALLAGLPISSVVVALDEIGNPHNLGAILRSAAFFGANAVLYPSAERQAHLSPAALRVAQGGAETVSCTAVSDLGAALRALTARGFECVAADPEGGRALVDHVFRRPTCIVLGNEGEGLSPSVRKACTVRLSIGVPGQTASVESLNVSVAAGILLSRAFLAS